MLVTEMLCIEDFFDAMSLAFQKSFDKITLWEDIK